uniref:Uncharacterized protein n=1 Tax=Nelumbo nucifera TaxID=4432 RepID=A0A822ZFU0_NELNU|nr:TPA_asm: hypothetical protein HUJ06_000539 [Nelumbo nucifera]
MATSLMNGEGRWLSLVHVLTLLCLLVATGVVAHKQQQQQRKQLYSLDKFYGTSLLASSRYYSTQLASKAVLFPQRRWRPPPPTPLRDPAPHYKPPSLSPPSSPPPPHKFKSPPPPYKPRQPPPGPRH